MAVKEAPLRGVAGDPKVRRPLEGGRARQTRGGASSDTQTPARAV
jgi:hypothetical protein